MSAYIVITEIRKGGWVLTPGEVVTLQGEWADSPEGPVAKFTSPIGGIMLFRSEVTECSDVSKVSEWLVNTGNIIDGIVMLDRGDENIPEEVYESFAKLGDELVTMAIKDAANKLLERKFS